MHSLIQFDLARTLAHENRRLISEQTGRRDNARSRGRRVRLRRSRVTASSRGTRSGALLGVATAVVGLALALAGTASAQRAFRAGVTGHTPKPMQCPNGEFFCGTANTDLGPAVWTFTLTSLTVSTCDSYTAAVTFQLADGSTLVLAEDGTACGPGKSNLSNASGNSYGHPGDAAGSWTVQSADGQFSGTTGTGTDALHFAGADVSGSYTGT